MKPNNNVFEKCYQQNPPNIQGLMYYPILFTFLICLNNKLIFYILNFLQIDNSFLFLIIYGLFVLIVFSLLYLLYYQINNNKKHQLIINTQFIATDLHKIYWGKNTQVYEITDFAGSNRERELIFRFNKNKYRKAFLIINHNQQKSLMPTLGLNNHSLLITSHEWNIGDGKELIEFFNYIEQSVQPINSKQVSQYIPCSADSSDLGFKSGIATFLSVAFIGIGIVVTQFDNAFTLDFGNMRYLAVATAVIIAIICFYWVKTKQKLWFAHVIVAVLFAGTCTFMLGSIMLTVSQNMGETKYHKFVYLGKVRGIKEWQHVANMDKTFSCRQVKEPIGTVKSVETKVFFGMTRFQEKQLCSE